MDDKSISFSIITVSYNAEETIETTIKSVINQTFDDFEYIIIDGGSTDTTVNIIKKYDEKIDYWVSEKDNGIYNAMNKGANEASGDYLFFLNADDYFYSKFVLKEVSEGIEDCKPDLVAGKVIRKYDNYQVVIGPKFNNLNLKMGIMPPHQASFVSSRLFRKIGGFNEKYISSGDFEFFCKLNQQKVKVNYINSVIAYFKAGGMSAKKKISLTETCGIMRKYFNIFWALNFAVRKIVIEQGLKNLLILIGLNKVYYRLSKLHNKGKL